MNQPAQTPDISIDLHDWQIAEGVGERLAGSQKAPVNIRIVPDGSKVSLFATMPTGAQHEISLELENGVLNMRAFLSAVGRVPADDPNLGRVHEDAALILRMGGDASVVHMPTEQCGADGHYFRFDHTDGTMTPITDVAVGRVVMEEHRAAALCVLPEKLVPAGPGEGA